mmetsp:Transcript_43678/g.87776  ORF Transcript_43678/g.87776 Transcript_43678/m.87776 type:complete len:310 (-) Transcript_43678:673-1602(-)
MHLGHLLSGRACARHPSQTPTSGCDSLELVHQSIHGALLHLHLGESVEQPRLRERFQRLQRPLIVVELCCDAVSVVSVAEGGACPACQLRIVAHRRRRPEHALCAPGPLAPRLAARRYPHHILRRLLEVGDGAVACAALHLLPALPAPPGLPLHHVCHHRLRLLPLRGAGLPRAPDGVARDLGADGLGGRERERGEGALEALAVAGTDGEPLEKVRELGPRQRPQRVRVEQRTSELLKALRVFADGAKLAQLRQLRVRQAPAPPHLFRVHAERARERDPAVVLGGDAEDVLRVALQALLGESDDRWPSV